jgi:hypothetical protein
MVDMNYCSGVVKAMCCSGVKLKPSRLTPERQASSSVFCNTSVMLHALGLPVSGRKKGEDDLSMQGLEPELQRAHSAMLVHQRRQRILGGTGGRGSQERYQIRLCKLVNARFDMIIPTFRALSVFWEMINEYNDSMLDRCSSPTPAAR